MTSSPHDALFKAAFAHPQHAAGLLRTVVAPELAEAADWSTLALEAGSFVDEALADRHSDLLFSVELGGHAAFVYVLLEHQSTVDPEMPLRVLEYMTRIWVRDRQDHPDRPRRPILPVVVSHAPGGWTAPTQFHRLFSPEPSQIPGLAEHVPAFRLLLVDVSHLTNEQIKASAMAAFPQLAVWLLRDARNADELLKNLDTWVGAFEAAEAEEHGLAALHQLMRYVLLVVHDLRAEEIRAIITRKVPRAATVMTTIAEQIRQESEEAGIQKGFQRGIKKGRQEAIFEGERRFLRALLEDKFGPLTPAQATKVDALDDAGLEQARKRFLTADGIDAVLG